MKLSFLGTGTSYGVPYIGCECAVCHSTNPHNKRLRASVIVEDDATRLLVDTTPDLRTQLLRAEVSSVSAIFWTHLHNDHVIGLDDIRPVSDRVGYIDGFADHETMARLKTVFDYVFVQDRDHGGFPRVSDHLLQPRQSVRLGDFKITAIPIVHGRRAILAYRFDNNGKSLVYATDCSHIPDASWELMEDADLLVLGALRHREHPTHFTLSQALAAVERLKPRRALFTHIAHDLEHEETNATLPPNVELAYDGLIVET